MLVEGWWFGACFVATGPGDLTVIEPHELLCIPKYSRVKCEGIRLTAKVGPKLGHAQDNDPKHTSKSTTERLKRKESRFCNSLVIVQTSSWLKSLVINKCPQTSINWSNVVKTSGPKLLQNNARDWWSHTEYDYFKLLLLKVELQAIES